MVRGVYGEPYGESEFPIPKSLTMYHAAPMEYERAILSKGILTSGPERYAVIERDILGLFEVASLEEAQEKLGRNTFRKLTQRLGDVWNRFESTEGVVYVSGGWSFAVQNCLGGYEVYTHITGAFPKMKMPREPVGKFWMGPPPSIPLPESLADHKAIGDSVSDWPVCTLFTLSVPWKVLNEDAQRHFLRVRDSWLGDGPIHRDALETIFEDWIEKKEYALKGVPDSPLAEANMFAAMVGIRETRIERDIPKSWIKDCYRVPWPSFAWYSR
jgi:hypothetical protein